MRKMTPYLGALPLMLMLACSSSSNRPVEIGLSAPSFALKNLAGAVIKNDSFKGKPIIINFWATWCQPCMKEIPTLKELDEKDEIDIVGIALDEGGPGPVKRFVKTNDIKYTVLLGNQEIFQRFNGMAIPYTLVLDSSHKIVNIHRGIAGVEDLKEDIRKL